MSPQVEVRNSPIHGRGVFALRDFVRGEFVLEYRGERITRAEMLARDVARAPNEEIYVFEIDDEHFIDATNVVENNPARFINHSCDENCAAVWNPSAGRMEIVAVRNISAGEELSFDYGFALPGFFEHPCHCGSPKCVHYIVAKTLRAELRKKLARHSGR